MLGMGVMLGYLAGNGESVAAYHAAIGKEIASLTLGEDDALHFVFSDGFKLKVSDEGQSCCESRYMRTDDDLQSFIGATVLGMEIKEAPSIEGEYGDSHDIQFFEVQTDRGVFTMASHNEHNGYYGGFCIRLAVEA